MLALSSASCSQLLYYNGVLGTPEFVASQLGDAWNLHWCQNYGVFLWRTALMCGVSAVIRHLRPELNCSVCSWC